MICIPAINPDPISLDVVTCSRGWRVTYNSVGQIRALGLGRKEQMPFPELSKLWVMEGVMGGGVKATGKIKHCFSFLKCFSVLNLTMNSKTGSPQ